MFTRGKYEFSIHNVNAVTSRKLANRKNVCIDATYKLNWMGFPLIIMGTLDRTKRFDPMIYACSSHERTEDYEFVFRSVKDAILKYAKKIFRPLRLIADGADAIRKAFYSTFPNAKMDIMSYVMLESGHLQSKIMSLIV